MGLLYACGRLRCLTPSALVFKDVEASWFVGEAAVDPERSKFELLLEVDAPGPSLLVLGFGELGGVRDVHTR